MWRESLSKQGTMMDTIARMREQMKTKQSEAAEQMVYVNGKLNDQEHKLQSMMKQMDMGFQTNAESARSLPMIGDAGGSNSPY